MNEVYTILVMLFGTMAYLFFKILTNDVDESDNNNSKTETVNNFNNINNNYSIEQYNLINTYINFIKRMSNDNYIKHLGQSFYPKNKYELMCLLYLNGWDLKQCFIMTWIKTEVQVWYNKKINCNISFEWTNKKSNYIILNVLKQLANVYGDPAYDEFTNNQMYDTDIFKTKSEKYMQLIEEINNYSQFDECQKIEY